MLIATGGSARRFTEQQVPGAHLADTSYEFFEWTELPKRVVVFGGGYIGVELASILNALGSEVHVVIRSPDGVLRGFDEDLREFLDDQYQIRGVNIHKKTSPVEFKEATTRASADS